jgi:hypothetical protein
MASIQISTLILHSFEDHICLLDLAKEYLKGLMILDLFKKVGHRFVIKSVKESTRNLFALLDGGTKEN